MVGTIVVCFLSAKFSANFSYGVRKAVYKKVADIINNDSRIDHTHKLSSYDEYSDNDGR